FVFQAEDGIRDPLVTGVQTCALPISNLDLMGRAHGGAAAHDLHAGGRKHALVDAVEACDLLVLVPDERGPVEACFARPAVGLGRSEERRVGTGWRWRSSGGALTGGHG